MRVRANGKLQRDHVRGPTRQMRGYSLHPEEEAAATLSLSFSSSLFLSRSRGSTVCESLTRVVVVPAREPRSILSHIMRLLYVTLRRKRDRVREKQFRRIIARACVQRLLAGENGS